jgi:hypothetical protein
LVFWWWWGSKPGLVYAARQELYHWATSPALIHLLRVLDYFPGLKTSNTETKDLDPTFQKLII